MKTKAQKGITLIALIITIVVLLILAAVAINAITQYNIIENANGAAEKYGNEAKKEQTTLGGYSSELNKYLGGTTGGNGSGSGDGSGEGSETIAFADALKTEMLQKTVNSKVVDEYGNQIVVPAGFKIRVDETTNNADNVTEGIVIEDAAGNQFVWVPVGTIYINADKTESKTIILGRYAYYCIAFWDDEGYDLERIDVVNNYIPNEHGGYTPMQRAEDYATKIAIKDDYYTEDTPENHNSNFENAIARNIGDFVNSSIQNGGYYIGRFEAGNENNTLVCKAGQEVYVDITQPDASIASKNMYNNGEDGYNANTFSSDLTNSYAWDTAIIFIQTFGGEDADSYHDDINMESITTTGKNRDEYCNINDMSGNAYEWTTETGGWGSDSGVNRGFYINTELDYEDIMACGRGGSGIAVPRISYGRL